MADATTGQPYAIAGSIEANLPRSLRACGAALQVVAVVLAIGFPIFVMVGDRDRVVSFVSDDAYYYFSVAENIATGNGPTADGITRTTGFHPLYAFLLAGVHWLTQPSVDGFVREAIALNAACFLLAGLFLYFAAGAWWGRRAGGLAALLWLANPNGTLVNVIGLEGSVYGMMLALLAWRLSVLINGKSSERSTAAWVRGCTVVGVCGGLVLLSRTDSLVFLAMLVPVMISVCGRSAIGRGLAGVGLSVVIALGMLALWWWYAWAHTGGWVQGSAAVKTLWRPEVVEEEYGRYTVGASLLFAGAVWLKYVIKCFLKVPALKWVVSSLPGLYSRGCSGASQRMLLHVYWVFPAAVGAAYALLIDRPRTWYYVPALVLLTLVAAGAAAQLIREPATNPLFAAAKRWLPVLGWLVVIECAAIGGRNMVYGRSNDQVGGLRGAEWVSKNIEADALIGCWHSGIVQYYTPHHTVINLDGLANNEILGVLRGERSMNAYWDARGIGVILGLPRQKMGGFAYEWDRKKLEPIREGVLRVVPDHGGVP